MIVERVESAKCLDIPSSNTQVNLLVVETAFSRIRECYFNVSASVNVKQWIASPKVPHDSLHSSHVTIGIQPDSTNDCCSS